MKTRPSTIGFWILVFYVLLLFGLREVYGRPPAVPDIRIVYGVEVPGHVGLTGAAPNSSQDGAATVYCWDGVLEPLALNVELINVGLAAWCPAPADIAWHQWLGPAVLDAVRLAVVDADGTVLRERFCALFMYDWDGFSICSGPYCTFGFCWPGLSPGHGANGWMPFWCDTWVDVAGLPAGEYHILVEFDPLNKWGLRRHVLAPCVLDHFDFGWN